MALPTGDVIGLMIDNLRKRGSVLPITTRSATRWAKGLDIPKGGKRVIYTGHMYQLIPYINGSVKHLERFENSFVGNLVFVARALNRVFNISKLMAIPARGEVHAYNEMLRNIALLLKRGGVEFGYLYGRELYTGALAYDLGAYDAFKEHARRVYSMLKDHAVESLITVDPHTTNMLRSVYPTVVDGYDVQVRSYLEVLAEKEMKPARAVDTDVVVHDSCVYARYENVVEEPRVLLRRAGYGIKEPKDTGRLTQCCGGPVESVYPQRANGIAKKRIEQLRGAKAQSVALMCPICLGALRKAAGAQMEINDVASLLARAFFGGACSQDRCGDEK